MSGIEDIYGGNYLNAGSMKSLKLSGKILTIKSIKTEPFGEKTKVVLGFAETDKEVALNKSNATVLGDAWGGEYMGWGNKKLMLVLTKVNFQGNMVDGIQVVPQ